MIRKQQGVTLLELMTALAVMAILMGIGVPAFNNIMRANQIAAESNNLLAALTLARSEAMKRGVRVSVCAAATETTCAAAANWSNGWIVFEDDFGAAGVIDPSDIPLQNWPGPASGATVTSDGGHTSVVFTRTGRAELERSFSVSKQGCSADQKRSIEVEFSGRVALTRVAC